MCVDLQSTKTTIFENKYHRECNKTVQITKCQGHGPLLECQYLSWSEAPPLGRD